MRRELVASAIGGELRGWIDGSGEPVLLLHGGPGIGFEYLDAVAVDIGHGFEVAAFQQRGLAPSVLSGPFSVDQAVDDVIAVLDGLRWPRATVVGHSWGGHLALRTVALHPDRLNGAVVVEPIGVVGDGGMSAFVAEVAARTPRDARMRSAELDQLAADRDLTGDEMREGMRLTWSAYFADPSKAPVQPEFRVCPSAFARLIAGMVDETGEIAARLSATQVPMDVVVGAGSPIPWGQAAQMTSELSSTATLTVLPGAGHFVWLDAPGCIRDALHRLGTESHAYSTRCD